MISLVVVGVTTDSQLSTFVNHFGRQLLEKLLHSLLEALKPYVGENSHCFVANEVSAFIQRI